ncbi:hypothetical protein ACFRJ3_43100 [Streptomyces sp. NPDC056696]|uniref:hypothetical protein n=1 Tax=Streptomyces sp. NPDC056696 TaxID=3345914 RepID=UPI0036A266B1
MVVVKDWLVVLPAPGLLRVVLVLMLVNAVKMPFRLIGGIDPPPPPLHKPDQGLPAHCATSAVAPAAP